MSLKALYFPWKSGTLAIEESNLPVLLTNVKI
jgi:hypothetical protein